jgi:hypothetical protein
MGLLYPFCLKKLKIGFLDFLGLLDATVFFCTSNFQTPCIRMGRNLQTTLAQELCNQLGEYNKNYFTLDDIANIEKVLNIQIKVVAAECFISIIYSGAEKDVKVYLYKNGTHFDTISSMTAFYGQSYYCEKCDKPYQNKDKHKCKTKDKICIMCFKSITKKTAKRIYCEKCNRYCFNQECLQNHSEVCEQFYKCLNCNKILKRRDKMVDEGNKMIEEGNETIEKGNNKINMFTGKRCPEMGMMIQKGT